MEPFAGVASLGRLKVRLIALFGRRGLGLRDRSEAGPLARTRALFSQHLHDRGSTFARSGTKIVPSSACSKEKGSRQRRKDKKRKKDKKEKQGRKERRKGEDRQKDKKTEREREL